ncbi:MAG: PQQ-binding-like beta-propeller repeat protein [Gammaproteobacteria bacterium]|nr:PQQ-binding-like beta-propeller repeat protein [Gammaproteobacteria bacterium]
MWTSMPLGKSEEVLFTQKRGLIYWQEDEEKRLFTGIGHQLIAIDPGNGQLIDTFGRNGIVDLREGLGLPSDYLMVAGSTPGVIYGELLIMGTRVGEHDGAAPGHIRAYDVRSGEMRWIFHTIPQPGEAGYETWPEDAWRTAGGVNAWAGMSVDEKRGLVFLPLGSPSSDFVGVMRPGANLYGNSMVVLDADDGSLRWHYQIVHHDLWDRDLNSPPTLITLLHEGEQLDAVVQTTKQGVAYVFNRVTGEPVFPIKETRVPQSRVPGEQSWPTQPLPELPLPFAQQVFDKNQLTDISPEAYAFVMQRFEKMGEHKAFTPLGFEESIVYPGFDGGASWGGGAFDPVNQTLFVNAMNYPSVSRIIAKEVNYTPAGEGELLYQQVCTFCHLANRQGIQHFSPSLVKIGERFSRKTLRKIIAEGRGRMIGVPLPEKSLASLIEYLLSADSESRLEEEESRTGRINYLFGGYEDFTDQEGYPASKPPWGTLTAINLSSGTQVWQVVLGEHEELTKRGVPQTGTRNYGGPLVTAGGLVFIAATSDEMIRGFHSENGDLLWEAKLPAAGYATPVSYSVNGKQYIAIACGGGKLGTVSGDAYVTFSLNEEFTVSSTGKSMPSGNPID